MKMMWLCAQKLVLTKEASEETILYIGGSDILPEPLGAQEEAKVLHMFTQKKKEKLNDMDAVNKKNQNVKLDI